MKVLVVEEEYMKVLSNIQKAKTINTLATHKLKINYVKEGVPVIVRALKFFDTSARPFIYSWAFVKKEMEE